MKRVARVFNRLSTVIMTVGALFGLFFFVPNVDYVFDLISRDNSVVMHIKSTCIPDVVVSDVNLEAVKHPTFGYLVLHEIQRNQRGERVEPGSWRGTVDGLRIDPISIDSEFQQIDWSDFKDHVNSVVVSKEKSFPYEIVFTPDNEAKIVEAVVRISSEVRFLADYLQWFPSRVLTRYYHFRVGSSFYEISEDRAKCTRVVPSRLKVGQIMLAVDKMCMESR